MEKIKILHSADMHGDLDSLDTYIGYARETKPDITLVTGDLINGVFTEEELKHYMKHQERYEETKMSLLKTIIEEANKEGMKQEIMELFPLQLFHAIKDETLKEKSIIDIHEDNEPSTKDLYDLIKNPKTPLAIGNAISQYLDIREIYEKHVKTGRESMETQYKDIKRIIEDTDCLILPGNHDGECLEEILLEKNIHKKSLTVKDIKIAGYGSAKGAPVWIPQALLEKFQGVQVANKQKELVYDGSEAGWFMIEEDPDISVLHETPLTDEGLKAYVQNESPYLILGGHLHDKIGIFKFNKDSYLIMPGKLGNPNMEPKDHSTLRTFVEIDMLKEKEASVRLQFEKIIYRQIKEGKIETFREYEFDENGYFKSKKSISKDDVLSGWL